MDVDKSVVHKSTLVKVSNNTSVYEFSSVQSVADLIQIRSMLYSDSAFFK